MIINLHDLNQLKLRLHCLRMSVARNIAVNFHFSDNLLSIILLKIIYQKSSINLLVLYHGSLITDR